MRRKQLDNLALAALAVAAFGLAGAMHAPLRDRRIPLQQGPVLHHGEAPPLVVFTTVALGGFRGLIADALWLRISFLQAEGRYAEVVQLADWITKLEPAITDVWAFHAWNMAYNISVMIPDAPTRWQWVRNGIRILRDEARRYNPHDPRVYAELGWLFQHKLGSNADRHHGFYRAQWAAAIEPLIPGGRLRRVRGPRETDLADRLKRELALDLDRLRVVDAKYGPLDWRRPQAHAVYWAYSGLQHAPQGKDLACRRMIFQSLADLALGGGYAFTGEGRQEAYPPQPRLIPRVLLAFDEALRDFPSPTMEQARARFLDQAAALRATPEDAP